MDEITKKLLTENSLARLSQYLNESEDSFDRLTKAITTLSVQASVIVLEEYEKLKTSS